MEGVARIIRWMDAHGGPDNSDKDPYDDRVIAAWRQAGEEMHRSLTDLDA